MSWEDDIAEWKTIVEKSDCKFQVMGEAGAELIDVPNILGRRTLEPH